jgi:hypothetical protein
MSFVNSLGITVVLWLLKSNALHLSCAFDAGFQFWKRREASQKADRKAVIF